MKKPESINVKAFLQGEKYAELKEQLSKEINSNNILFNLKIPQKSNLLEPKVLYKMQTLDRSTLKLAKKAYKPTKEARLELLAIFAKCEEPKYQYKFSMQNI